MRWRAYRDQGDLPCVVSNECQVRLDVGEGTVFLADAGEDAEQEVVFGLAGQQEGLDFDGELVGVGTAVKLHRLRR